MTSSILEMNNPNDYKKCPACNRLTCGVEDYYSLIKGSTTIKKTCKKCRLLTYKCYKQNHPDKFKLKDINKDINYDEEYKNRLRCPACNRRTMGESDFKHSSTDRLVKTCKKCRNSVLKSYQKREMKKEPRIPKKTQKEVIEELKNNTIHQALINVGLAPKGGNYDRANKLLSQMGT